MFKQNTSMDKLIAYERKKSTLKYSNSPSNWFAIHIKMNRMTFALY